MLLSDVGKSSASNITALEKQIFHYIDENQNKFVQVLKEWVAVESDSIQPKYRQNITQMIEIAKDKLQALGADVCIINLPIHQNSSSTEPRNLGMNKEKNNFSCRKGVLQHKIHTTNSPKLQNYWYEVVVQYSLQQDDQNSALPPVILAELGKDENKPTVCFYGHLDVMPAKKADGWETDPYILTERNGNLYGRGATDDKGPVLAWIHAVEAFRLQNLKIPVNIKFVLEGMEEAGSTGLEDLIKNENERFFSNISYIVISDNTWLSKSTPALTYGSRGNACFAVTVEGGVKDLHSGAAGGIVHEPMSDLIALLDSLVDSSGHILIPGIYDDVSCIVEEQKKQYEPIAFNLTEYKADVGVTTLLYDTKEDILSHLWCYPSLSVHGIEGAFHEPGIKTVIPRKVIGKFSIRQVPDMNLTTVETQVKQHLRDVFAKRQSPNKLTVEMTLGAMPWFADSREPQYEAAKKAIKKVFQKDPDMIRDGSTIPIASMFEKITKKKVMMFPIGASDDGEHSQQEKISRYNYINGTKVFASFLLEISELHKD
ncbi:beta-Ala-His dipeptidase-like isoform X2 [Hemicordylus capensis]|nr:beta-Ala-His dipeptidase-like isoform X2 [Hemicordylus capensis]